MIRLRALAVIGGLSLSGCGILPDHSLDYRQAANLKPLVLPEGKTAAGIQPLYVIPELPPAKRELTLTEGEGRKTKFAIPAPAPLAEMNTPVAPVSTGAAAKPRVVIDGNGTPVLQAEGNEDQVWDHLGRALENSKIRVDDRNRSLGIYFIKLPAEGKAPELQLKMTRTAGTTVLFLQINEETVADADTAKQLFARLLENWPA
ncbi:MAG TPA: outer membrane protein assembly factor BamC [Fluviicoccus sp.]|nr:outer membrane protein assembly factor BamC [Fluviicoccus sp.]